MRVQRGARRINLRQVKMTIHRGAPMSGHMFDHGQDAPRQHAICRRTAQSRHGIGRRAVTTVAQESVGLRPSDIDHRRAIAVDAHAVQLVRDQSKAQIHCLCRVGACCLHEVQRCRPVAPMRCAQTLHPPAFLIHGDNSLVARRLAQFITQRADLIRRVDIARKENEPKGLYGAKQRLFLRRQPKPRRVQYRRPVSHQRVTTGMQSVFSATSAEQKRRASAMSENPCARRR